jgi:hypothetical protein
MRNPAGRGEGGEGIGGPACAIRRAYGRTRVVAELSMIG